MEILWYSSENTLPVTLLAGGEMERYTFRTVSATENIPDHGLLILAILTPEDSQNGFAWLDRSGTVCVFEPGATVAGSIRWIKAGAAHVAATAEELEEFLETAYFAEPEPARQGNSRIGSGPAAEQIDRDIQKVADRRCNVLIEGETGTGKEVVARAIHATGKRSCGPWIAVNCGAIPETLLEAELFGYVRGAFTGAIQTRQGKFEAANHGTIFLDEIGDLPLATQAKLLRVLQEREVEKLGGNETIRLDVRVIAATNVDLAARVEAGLFRQDLYYRLSVFRMELPPLRDRSGDIAHLASHFTAKVCANEHLAPKILDRSTIMRLERHSWPGNIRELENAIETAVVNSGSRSTIFPSDLRIMPARRPARPETAAVVEFPPSGLDYQETLDRFEKDLLAQALTRTRGNKTAAAQLLGLKRTTLTAKMRSLESSMPRLVA